MVPYCAPWEEFARLLPSRSAFLNWYSLTYCLKKAVSKRAASGIRSNTLSVGAELQHGYIPSALHLLYLGGTGYQNFAAVWILSSWMTLKGHFCCLLMMLSLWLCQTITSCDLKRKSGAVWDLCFLSSGKGRLLCLCQKRSR